MDEFERAKYRRIVIVSTIVWSLPVLLPATWLALRELPSQVACSFQNVWLLRMLWPPNAVTYEELKFLHFSDVDKCMILAGRSIFSAYAAALTGLLICMGWRHQPPYKDNQLVPATFGLIFAIGYCALFSKFDDQYHGRHAELVYKTSNGAALLATKALLHILIACSTILFWLMSLQDFFRAKIAEIKTHESGHSLNEINEIVGGDRIGNVKPPVHRDQVNGEDIEKPRL